MSVQAREMQEIIDSIRAGAEKLPELMLADLKEDIHLDNLPDRRTLSDLFILEQSIALTLTLLKDRPTPTTKAEAEEVYDAVEKWLRDHQYDTTQIPTMADALGGERD